MSQGSCNYIDDVPIILSAKWKIPPLPNIPNIAGFFDTTELLKEQSFHYDYSLENKVLEKVEEWKLARSREIDEREQRIKLRQEAKRQALEAEGTKLKEQLTQVSYPSPDEFSSSDDDDNNEKIKDSVSKEKSVDTQTFNTFDSILKPTVVMSNESNIGLEALSNITMSKSPGNVWNFNKNTSKLELADFENDASDPFYSMELKTIDDLDILAQVLKTSVTLHSKVNKSSSSNNNNNNNDSSSEIKSDNDKLESNDDEESLKTDPVPKTQEPTQSVTSQNCYTTEPYVGALPQYPNTGFTSSLYNPNIYSNYSQSPYYSGTNYYGTEHSYMPSTYNALSTPYTSDSPSFMPNPRNDSVESKLRSKSVPDIVKELEDELQDSQKRRIRNNSQCQEEERKRQSNDRSLKILNNCENSNINAENQNCDDILMKKLPKELQNLAMKISQMGFPLDRVCRIAQQVNGDDKKIIEHLIPLTELLDLGFEEKTISDALLKFDNNKEKALEFLIS